MAEPTPKHKTYFGLPLWGWAASLGGAVVVWILYKRHEANAAATAAEESTATTGGNTIPSGQPVTTTSPTYSTLEQWESAMLSAMAGPGLSTPDALNGITDWLNGSCVEQNAYNGLSSALSTVGLPPGFSTLPSLSVCASTPKPTPGPTKTTSQAPGAAPSLAPALKAAMTNNGESVVSTAWDATLHEWVYLTNKGGIYTQNANGGTTGTTFYGSYLGLPTADTKGVRNFVELIINPNGTYTAVANTGQTYTFTPTTPQKSAAPKTPVKA
jgi:hypothetical protein